MHHSTASEHLIASLAVLGEPDELQLVNLHPSIRSITVLQECQPAWLGDQVKDYAKQMLPSDIEDTFVVTDLLEDISYLVAETKSSYKLTFALKEGQMIVAGDPAADITEVAHMVVIRLRRSGAHLHKV